MEGGGGGRVLIDASDPTVKSFLMEALKVLRPAMRVESSSEGLDEHDLGWTRGLSLAIVEERPGGRIGALVRTLRKRGNPLPVIVTSRRTRLRFRTAPLGSVHHLRKPFGLSDLREVLEVAIPGSHRSPPLALEVPEKKACICHEPLLGKSRAIQTLMQEVSAVAPSNLIVLLRGRPGSGKEYFAHLVHRHSKHSAGPFVPVDCGTLPASLIESELFGCEKGAFTGAEEDRKGLVESAQGGTLFLDEVGDLPMEFQPKLLRLLQEREFRRVGSPVYHKTDARILAATNADIEALLQKGRFREDLYHRLNEAHLQIPCLSERIEDVPILLEGFLAEYARLEGRTAPRLTARAVKALLHHPWPGNVRELQIVAKRLVSGPAVDQVDVDDLPAYLENGHKGNGSIHPARKRRPRPEKESVILALRECQGVPTHAADRLGISRSRLYRLMKRYGLSRESQ